MISLDQSNQIYKRIQNSLHRIPVSTRLIIFISSLAYLFCTLQSSIMSYINNDNQKVTNILPVWQIYMIPYIDFISYIAEIFMYYIIGNYTERKIGTVRYSIFVVINLIVLEFVHWILYFLVSTFVKGLIMNFRNQGFPGLWGLFMVDVMIRYNKNPENNENWYISAIIKSKYVPFIYFFSLSLLFPISLRLFSGLIIGYLCNSYIDINNKLNFLYISDTKTQELEKSSIFSCLRSMKTFIKISDLEKSDIKQEIELQDIEIIHTSTSSLSENDYELLEEQDKSI